MDWSNVTAGELVDALREVELQAPRPLWEFFTRFSIPKNQAKWASRVKCNVYYYRTNYLAVLTLALSGAFLRHPHALAATALALLGLLLFNDPFAAAFNDAAIRAIRKLHPRTAAVLRSQLTSDGNLGATVHRRPAATRVVGLQRHVFVGLLLLGALYLLYRTRPLLPLCWGVLLGAGIPLAHATVRSPNLKARLASPREEFRAVWRGYQADMGMAPTYGRTDYTL